MVRQLAGLCRGRRRALSASAKKNGAKFLPCSCLFPPASASPPASSKVPTSTPWPFDSFGTLVMVRLPMLQLL